MQKQAHLQEVGAVLPAAEVGDGPRRGSMGQFAGAGTDAGQGRVDAGAARSTTATTLFGAY